MLRNQGTGTFVLERQPAAPQKQYLKLRDLNGDGAPDAIFGGLGFALNDGTGTFGPIASVATGSASGGMETLDMDGDGDLDAVVSGGNSSGYGIFALENDGAGAFGAPSFFTAPGVSRAGPVVTGDFTNDGHADTVSGDWQTVWLWSGDGAGGFAAPVQHGLGSGGAVHLVAADLDGDGNLDVAGSHWGSQPLGSTLAVLFGNGDGTFAPPVTYLGMFSQWRAGIGGLTVGDADGDGDLDLIGGCFGANDVAIFPNNGDRTFGPEQRYGVDGDVTAVVAGDFNGDGRTGVAVNIANWTTYEGGVTVLLTPEVATPRAPRRSSIDGRRPAGPLSR